MVFGQKYWTVNVSKFPYLVTYCGKLSPYDWNCVVLPDGAGLLCKVSEYSLFSSREEAEDYYQKELKHLTVIHHGYELRDKYDVVNKPVDT